MIQFIKKHLTKCIVAGIVALLPLVSVVITVVYFENMVASSWLADQGFYFFGLGLILAVVLIYLVGLTVTNIIGRWLWKLADRVLDRLPILGRLYQTVKQLLGYGEGPDAIFQRVVFVMSKDLDGEELGLVTHESPNHHPDCLAVFVPNSPSPANGRLVYVEPAKVRDAQMTVNDALKLLVSIGTLEEQEAAAAGSKSQS